MVNHIPPDEFQHRLENVRQAMARESHDALVVYSQKRGHVSYLSGYHANYHTNAALMLITAKREPTLWIRFAFDLSRAKATSWLEDIRTCASDDAGTMIGHCAQEIQSHGIGSSRIGFVASDLAVDELSLSMHERMCRELPKAQVLPASHLVNELRLTKSQNEIELLRQAAELAELVSEAFRKSIRPGVTDWQAAAVAEHAGKLEGAEQCDFFISTDPAFYAFPPSGLEFKAGSSVTFEITVRYRGYWVQICRAFAFGKPTREQTHVFNTCRDAYQAILQAARPGASTGKLAEAAQDVIAAAGFNDCIPYGVGHGVGLDLPELYPVEPEGNGRLHPGIVLVVHPSIWAPKQGATYFGGPIAVTEDGAVQLDNPVSEMVVI